MSGNDLNISRRSLFAAAAAVPIAAATPVSSPVVAAVAEEIAPTWVVPRYVGASVLRIAVSCMPSFEKSPISGGYSWADSESDGLSDGPDWDESPEDE